MVSPRLLIPGVALAALAVLAGPALSQETRPPRTASRIQVPFRPSAPISPEVVKGLDLSEEYLNWAKNRANKTNVDGGKFDDIIRGYQAFGMVSIGDMPNRATFDPKHPDTPRKAVIASGKGFERFPFTFIKRWNNQRGMSVRELEATKAAVSGGHPVATGIWWLERFETVAVEHVPLLKEYPRRDNTNSDSSKNPMFDGHSIDLVGFHEGPEFPGGGYFVFRNSFGPGFGHDGYGFVSFKYIRDYANDAIYVGR
jgi:hypothetical protein